ncbi:hypothetical protein KFK09_015491 [Dendrobium nobile]|uniref:Uncharacterized protein n=1 Tax=Dendrobium nobile TaxID=94219 RepID=A0A8T3B6Y8_DENNO|nr:hypothetical protein KFK09_015491 [Dendrobium nobile]
MSTLLPHMVGSTLLQEEKEVATLRHPAGKLFSREIIDCPFLYGNLFPHLPFIAMSSL